MSLSWRRRSVLWIVIGWTIMNAILVWYLDIWRSDPVFTRKLPSKRAIAAYKLHAASETPVSHGHLQERPVELKYRVLLPAAGAGPVPLVVFLHGAGERGQDNLIQLFGFPDQLSEPEMRSRFPCICLAPQCPERSDWTRHLDSLEQLIEQWRSDPRVDPCRIYLTGLSMGGFGTWHLAARRPDLFAAVVPICGGGNPSAASKLVGLPIWAVHGQEDPVVPASQSRAMIEAIRAAGGRPEYTELPGVGHDSWTATYRDPKGPLPWMFRQARTGCRP